MTKMGDSVGHLNLTLVPLMGGEGHGQLDYCLAADAIATGVFTVTEMSQGGAVPLLAVVSEATRMVLLLDGEELIGAKQNRILNTSVLVPAKSKINIPVSCVEQGRWRHVSPDFQSGGYRTGVRIGELSHLTWRSVNMAERFLLVQPEPDGGGNIIANWSKTWAAKGHRIRLQVLDEEIVGHLTALRQRAVYDLVAVGLALDDAERLCAFSTAQTDAVRVFGGPNPDRFEKDFRRACKEVCEKLNLPPIRPHGRRKTYGTVLAERGLNEFALASVMGHRDPKTTRDYYVLLRQKKLCNRSRPSGRSGSR